METSVKEFYYCFRAIKRCTYKCVKVRQQTYRVKPVLWHNGALSSMITLTF